MNRDKEKKFGILPIGVSKHPWSEGTCLIIGDSLIGGVQERRLGPKYKVRSFPGAVVNDFYYYVTPLLAKKPSSMIIMAGTNDAPMKSSKDIFDELMKLKHYIENEAPDCKVYISCPTPRVDDSFAQLVIKNLRRRLRSLGLDAVIINDNIHYTELSWKGLYLKISGLTLIVHA